MIAAPLLPFPGSAQPHAVAQACRSPRCHLRASTIHQSSPGTTWRVRPRSASARFQTSLSVTPAMREQWSLVGQRDVRITVRHPGWYGVTWGELRAAGWRNPTPAGRLELFTDGHQVPIQPNRGVNRSSGVSAFRFYGEGRTLRTTGERVLWLTSGAVARHISEEASPTAGAPQPFFSSSVTAQPRTVYFALTLPHRQDHIFGPILDQHPVSVSVPVTNLSTAQGAPAAQLTVGLQGVSDAPHAVTVSVGGSTLGSISFKNTDHGDATFAVPLDLLHNGSDAVTLTPGSTAQDVSLTDTLTLVYPRLFRATGNRLQFTIPGGTSASVDGFSRAPSVALDVTNPSDPHTLHLTVSHTSSGYIAQIGAGGTGQRTIEVVAAAARPAAIAPNHPIRWHDPAHRADLIIITTHALMPALKPLITRRRHEGLAVAVIDVASLYDEFDYGIHGPDAIKVFLSTALSQWTGKPRYVLLAGGASYDPRGYLHHPASDLVPTELIDAGGQQTASDETLADFTGSGIPAVAIGRIPARSPAQLRTAIAKILAFTPEHAGDRAVLVVGHNHEDDLVSFPQENNTLAHGFPASWHTTSIVEDPLNDTATTGRIVSAINSDPWFVNYLGHGSVNLWSGILTAGDVSRLHNRAHPALFAMMTCLNGYFIEPSTPSLGEDLLFAPGGGAAGVWSSTGETAAVSQIAINRALVHHLFHGKSMRIGDVIRAASSATSDPDVRRTWVFLGDPSMPIH